MWLEKIIVRWVFLRFEEGIFLICIKPYAFGNNLSNCNRYTNTWAVYRLLTDSKAF